MIVKKIQGCGDGPEFVSQCCWQSLFLPKMDLIVSMVILFHHTKEGSVYELGFISVENLKALYEVEIVQYVRRLNAPGK